MYGDHKRRVYVNRQHIIAAATAMYAYYDIDGPASRTPLISDGLFACRCPIQRALDAKYQSAQRWTVYSDEAIGDGHHWTLDRAGRNLVWQFDTEYGCTPRHVRLTA